MVDYGNDFDLASLGSRVNGLRIDARLTLDELATRAGISRSMLAAVEAGTKAPTVLILHKIARGLGTSMSRLIDDERIEAVTVLRRDEQKVLLDPAGWERRNLAPNVADMDVEIMLTTLPVNVDAGSFPPHAPGSREYLVVEEGSLLLTLGDTEYLLETGDSITYRADLAHGFSNAGEKSCSYILVVINGATGEGM